MSSKFQAMRFFLQARLSQHIVLWVFASILLIEFIILVPSIQRRQQELLTQMRDLSTARVEGALAAIDPANTETELLGQLRRLAPSQVVRGGALYRATGEEIDRFGEAPTLSFVQVKTDRQATFYDRAQSRYDAAWTMQQLNGKYLLIVRHDTTAVQQELLAFTGRILLLVLIISIFVTLVTLLGIERTLVTPILLLRSDLLKMGRAVQQNQPPPEFDSLRLRRTDELGEVIAAFDQMYKQVSDSIAERTQVEQALRQSEEKFAKAFRSSPSAILISTLREGRLIEVNDSFLQLYGSSLAEVIGQTASDLNLWAAPEYRAQMVEQLQQTGAARNLEYTFRNRQGEPRSILFSAELITLDGEDCLLSVANDITERKQAERALERLAEIGELAAMIVHEVRNPLTTVLMGLQSFTSLDLSERARLRLDLALDEAQRLQRLLNEILQYARCQALQTVELELNSLIQEMLEPIRDLPFAQGRQIDFAPTEPVPILADPDKLKQVFINLVSNACEAVSEGETIRWSLAACGYQRRACVEVHNGGDPIPPEILAQLTKPFFTTKSSGNGLGLAIVRQIVEAHRGELEILSSAEVGGTLVRVTLPYTQEI
ncbi:MAG: two-component system sensor histidine kinase NtrB [Elainella sp.]